MSRYLYTIVFGLYSITCFSQTEEWNLDFESWDELRSGTNLVDTAIESHVAGYPSNWHFNPEKIVEGSGIGQTSDAVSGKYAVTLSGFYQHPVMRITTGSDPIHPGWPIDFKPNKLTGNYKAILIGPTSDSLRAYVDVYLTKYNVSTSSRDTIGEGHLILIERNDYRDFEVDMLYYVEHSMPDTIIIVLAKERFGLPLNGNECYECSHVYFDNFELVNSTVSYNKFEIKDEYDCYPNPVINQLFIENKSNASKVLHLFDDSGRFIRKITVSPKESYLIPVGEIRSNIVFVSDGTTVRKVLIRY